MMIAYAKVVNYRIENKMMTQDKVNKLEEKGFNWFEIAELLDISYEEVRELAEESEK